jgi:LmbE family N-acetylglucosaminyl deacetylase
MGTHLFLSPHLDDAVLSCGGVIHQLAWGGERVIIVTAMAGEPHEPLPDSPVVETIRVRWNSGDFPYRTRRVEDVHAAQALRAQVYHLPLVEAALRGTICGAGDWIALYPDYESPFQGLNDADDARLFLLETHLPFTEVTAIYAPLGVDEHVDHRLVRDWALVLTGSQGAPALRFYAEYPHARQKSSLQRALAFYHQHLPAVTLDPEIRVLTDDDCAAKIRAMGCYQSHLHVLWNDPAEMERLARDYMMMIGDGTPAELFWRVAR